MTFIKKNLKKIFFILFLVCLIWYQTETFDAAEYSFSRLKKFLEAGRINERHAYEVKEGYAYEVEFIKGPSHNFKSQVSDKICENIKEHNRQKGLKYFDVVIKVPVVPSKLHFSPETDFKSFSYKMEYAIRFLEQCYCHLTVKRLFYSQELIESFYVMLVDRINEVCGIYDEQFAEVKKLLDKKARTVYFDAETRSMRPYSIKGSSEAIVMNLDKYLWLEDEGCFGSDIYLKQRARLSKLATRCGVRASEKNMNIIYINYLIVKELNILKLKEALDLATPITKWNTILKTRLI